jgi:hypothetical protein
MVDGDDHETESWSEKPEVDGSTPSPDHFLGFRVVGQPGGCPTIRVVRSLPQLCRGDFEVFDGEDLGAIGGRFFAADLIRCLDAGLQVRFAFPQGD